MAGAFKRVGRDRVRVRLAHDEVAVLRGLPDQLRTVLGEGEDEPVNRRLFPPAYLDVADIERDTEYHRLMHDDLVEGKLANLDLVTGSSTAARPRSAAGRSTSPTRRPPPGSPSSTTCASPSASASTSPRTTTATSTTPTPAPPPSAC